MICAYFESLNLFVRVWIACGGRKAIEVADYEFWHGLVRTFCASRSVSLDQLTGRTILSADGGGVELVKSLFYTKKCSRSGCYQMFSEWLNHPTACRFHTGKMKPTGLLSCCRGKGFRSPGCRQDYHDGLFFAVVHLRRGAAEAKEKSKQAPSHTPSAADESVERTSLPPLSSLPPQALKSSMRVHTQQEAAVQIHTRVSLPQIQKKQSDA